ncbi:MAG: glycosyltransferase family 2 protein [Mycobacteriales bacterium]
MTDLINVRAQTALPGGLAGVSLAAGASLLEDDAIQISVVMPCLNEASSVGRCVELALRGIERSGLTGEVIVCDNGSVDASVEVARAAGAVVVHEPRRGYGNAYRRAFAEARGRYLVMGDSDCSYDFSRLDELVAPLLDGYDYVLGSRFSGQILPGAMPWTHRYIGNPVLTGALNRLFGLKTSDAHSGMRAFSRDAYRRMALRSEGMEFASEVVVRAAQTGLRMTEVPIVYHPRVGDSKLRGLRDALRHLRYMLLQCPRQLFVVPGSVLLGIGIVAQVGLLAASLGQHEYTAGILVSACFGLLAILGYQAMLFGLFAFVHPRAPGPPPRLVRWVERRVSVERGVSAGLVLFLIGTAVDLILLLTSAGADLGLQREVHAIVASLTMMALGVQTSLGALFLGVFRHHSPAAEAARLPGEQLAAGGAAR